ncbi:MAG TPA: GntR family transcriptional regulator [Pararobbsia sp.]|jgi:DNA-binding GntR family transcriptional regulator|nr:GntR family transcriptional regulator [Pararobbsia sp.]
MKPDRNDPQVFVSRVLGSDPVLDRSKPLPGQIYYLLRNAIVTMQLNPMDVIFERALAETLGISRTPVREALLQLAREDLVLIAAQSGTYVAPVRREQFVESALIRRVLETASIRHAAEIISEREIEQLKAIHDAHKRALDRGDAIAAIAYDNAFHETVSRAAKLPKVQQLVALARAPIDRVRHITVRDPVVGQETLRQHERVLDALTQHNPDAAESALRAHLDEAFARQQREFDARAALFSGEE